MGQEALLLHQVIDGDPKAQRELYERYAGHAMSVCLRYIADRDAVMDVMQDAFVKVFTSIQMFHYRGEGSLKAWVLRIAANESLNYLRRNKRLTFSEELPELADEGDHPDVDGVPMEQLLQMIGSLPVGYRTVFNLYVFEGMSHKEIATELNIRENSSASQFLRAKRMLANMIKEWNKSKRR